MTQHFLNLAMTASALLAITGPRAAGAEARWPQWRGPLGTGHSHETGLPVKWTAKDVVWTTLLRGRGQSSPVAWGDRIFLTTATDDGRNCLVVCLDRLTGRVLWERSIRNDQPEQIHPMNSWATPTCATDGNCVVAYFGDGGLHGFGLDGKKLWSRELGRFQRAGWGTGSSPVIVGELVIQTCDADNDAFLVAVHKQTGAEVWRTPRPRLRSFSTPVLVDAGSRRELVVNGHSGMQAYDPQTGKPLWFCTGASGRGEPTVVTGHGLVIAISGRSQGDGDLMVVRPGGTGDVTQTHGVWRCLRGGRDLPSPIVVGEFLVTVNLRPGLAACYEVKTGKELWKQRLGGQFSASSIAAAGLVYLLSEAGETIVIKPDRQYQELARNQFGATKDEVFRASPMAYAGQLFFRSDMRLYCIGRLGPPK